MKCLVSGSEVVQTYKRKYMLFLTEFELTNVIFKITRPDLLKRLGINLNKFISIHRNFRVHWALDRSKIKMHILEFERIFLILICKCRKKSFLFTSSMNGIRNMETVFIVFIHANSSFVLFIQLAVRVFHIFWIKFLVQFYFRYQENGKKIKILRYEHRI